MSALDTLRALIAGQRPETGLLHSCRLEAIGTEAYGEDAVVELFGLAGCDLSDNATAIEVAGHAAIFDGETALFADVAQGGITRIWLLCASDPSDAEPRIDVPHDPDLAQARGDVFFEPNEHPALAADAGDRVRLAGRALSRDPGEQHWHDSRPRAFAIRAFGDAAHGVALFAVSRLAVGPIRRSGFTFALARWSADGLSIIHDAAGEQALSLHRWTPRVGA
jgi:hypothetical protein